MEQLGQVGAARATVWCSAEVLWEEALLFSLIWPGGFVKGWQKLPVRTGSNPALHWLLFSGGADEAFHSEVSPSLISRDHAVLPYSLQYLLQEKCVASACLGLSEYRCIWQWMSNKSDMKFQNFLLVMLPQDLRHLKNLEIFVWREFLELP